MSSAQYALLGLNASSNALLSERYIYIAYKHLTVQLFDKTVSTNLDFQALNDAHTAVLADVIAGKSILIPPAKPSSRQTRSQDVPVEVELSDLSVSRKVLKYAVFNHREWCAQNHSYFKTKRFKKPSVRNFLNDYPARLVADTRMCDHITELKQREHDWVQEQEMQATVDEERLRLLKWKEDWAVEQEKMEEEQRMRDAKKEEEKKTEEAKRLEEQRMRDAKKEEEKKTEEAKRLEEQRMREVKVSQTPTVKTTSSSSPKRSAAHSRTSSAGKTQSSSLPTRTPASKSRAEHRESKSSAKRARDEYRRHRDDQVYVPAYRGFGRYGDLNNDDHRPAKRARAEVRERDRFS